VVNSWLKSTNILAIYYLMGWTSTSRGGPRQVAGHILDFPKSQHGIRSLFSTNENHAFPR
jgi:hypothetical protein